MRIHIYKRWRLRGYVRAANFIWAKYRVFHCYYIVVIRNYNKRVYNARNVFVRLYFLPRQKLFVSTRDFHIPRNNTARHSRVPEQRLATVFGYFYSRQFFFFLSTALYSIYAQRATTIKLLLRRCDTRSAAILVVYYYIAIIGIYRLSDRSHSTPLRPIAPLYYVPPSSLPNIPDLHVLQSRFFSFYPSLKFNDIYGYEF